MDRLQVRLLADRHQVGVLLIQDLDTPGLSDHAESQAKGGKGKNPANPEDVQAGQSDWARRIDHGADDA